jgi:Nif-specific regulatory protein
LAILIRGERGTGKALAAQLIHDQSRRRDQPLLTIRCAAVADKDADSDLESQLFGHEEAISAPGLTVHPGKFELAAGGTIFLDEIGDLNPGSQARLFQVLEQRTLVRVGGSTPTAINVRILATTSRDLAEMVRQQRFREELFFHFNAVTLDLPPLRQRPGDIPLLAAAFLQEFCDSIPRKAPGLSAAAQSLLMEYLWPGNADQLRNLMGWLAYHSPADAIEAKDLASIFRSRGQALMGADAGQLLADATVRFQAEFIRRAIAQSDGNMSRAASRLGLHRSNLYRKMRQLGMEMAAGSGE